MPLPAIANEKLAAQAVPGGRLTAVLAAVANDTTEVVAAPAAGKAIQVVGGLVAASVAGAYTWKSAATAKTGAVPIAANGAHPAPLIRCAAAEALNVTTDATAALEGWIEYVIVDA
jgi:hypothetical protein